MAARVRPLVLRMDPRSDGFDERTLRVSERIQSVRARTRVLSGRIADLTRLFLDDDLVTSSGPQQGQRLSRPGRIQWLSRLALLHRSYCAACDEEAQLQALLRRIEESGECPSKAPRGAAPCNPAATQAPA